MHGFKQHYPDDWVDLGFGNCLLLVQRLFWVPATLLVIYAVAFRARGLSIFFLVKRQHGMPSSCQEYPKTTWTSTMLANTLYK